MHLADEALEFLAEVCDGDARRALSALEIGVMSSDQRPLEFTRDLAEQSVQRKAVSYDATGDAHYDAASALIKSLRGSDPDAALYWLARMLEGGEDVRFLCRRLIILASEDIGNADPHALPLADRRDAGLRIRGPAGMPAHAGPGRDLSGLRPEIERLHAGHWPGAARCARKPTVAGARAFARRALSAVPNNWAMARATNMRTTRRVAWPRRTIWGSTASTTNPSNADLKRSWHDAWNRSEPA